MNFTNQQAQPTQPFVPMQPALPTVPFAVPAAQSAQDAVAPTYATPVPAAVPTEGTASLAVQQGPSGPTPTFVVFNEYTTARITCSQPEKKTVPNTGQNANPPSAEQNYHLIPLLYDYSTSPTSRVLNEFQLEAPELTTTHGIRSQVNVQSNRTDHSIMARFDVSNPEHARFLEVMNEIHAGCAQMINAYKGAVKMPHFNPNMAMATGFKDPIYRQLDELTGKPIEGRAPSYFFKLFSRGKPPFVEQTIFTGLDNKPIPWTVLQNVEMKFIPLLHFKRIYAAAGKASLQVEMISAVVTHIKGRGTASTQTATIARLQQARPELGDTVAAQVAKLTAERQELMLAGSDKGATATNNVDATATQPSYAGIPGYQAPAQPPAQGNLPNIPALNVGQQSMGDFTGGAPQRMQSFS